MKGPLSSLFRTAAMVTLSLVPPPRVAAFLRQGAGTSLANGSRHARARDQRRNGNAAADASRRDSAVDGGGQPQQRVVVLGGGFGGLYTALRLSQLAAEGAAAPKQGSGGGLSITVVDSRDKFVFLPLLYELATGQAELEEVAPRMEDVLRGTGITFVQGGVDALDLATQTVRVAEAGSFGGAAGPPEGEGGGEWSNARELPYDRLVIALGSQPRNLEAIPGAQEFSIPFYTVEDAYRLQRELARLDALMDAGAAAPAAEPQGASGDGGTKTVNVVVVGGGYSGVELACNLAGRSAWKGAASLTLVERGDGVLSQSTLSNRQRAEAKLAATGVNVRCATSVLAVTEGGLSVAPREAPAGAADDASPEETISADVVIWTAGSKPNDWLSSPANDLSSAAETDESGRLLVDKMLQIRPAAATAAGQDLGGDASPLFEKGTIFALGDNAASTADPMPSTAQVAFQQSEYAAWNVWASLSDEKKLAFRFIPLGEMLTLGADDAAISAESLLGPDLGAAVAKLSGPLASLARRAVYAARMPTPEQQMVAALGLSQGPLKRLLSRALETAAEGGMKQQQRK
jgi:NADH:ubiquinone reductase (non-electrogenic)